MAGSNPVYVACPELSPDFGDTFFKCELLSKQDGQCRLRIDAVHAKGGVERPSLTAKYRDKDKPIIRKSSEVFDSPEALWAASSNDTHEDR